MPAGLSTTTRPECMAPRSSARSERGGDPRDEGVGVEVGAEPRGESVAAATVGLGNPADVDVAERAEAHPVRAVVLLLEHARDLGFLRAPQDVDETLDLVETHVVALEHVPGDHGPDEALLAHELCVAECLAQQLQV